MVNRIWFFLCWECYIIQRLCSFFSITKARVKWLVIFSLSINLLSLPSNYSFFKTSHYLLLQRNKRLRSYEPRSFFSFIILSEKIVTNAAHNVFAYILFFSVIYQKLFPECFTTECDSQRVHFPATRHQLDFQRTF